MHVNKLSKVSQYVDITSQTKMDHLCHTCFEWTILVHCHDCCMALCEHLADQLKGVHIGWVLEGLNNNLFYSDSTICQSPLYSIQMPFTAIT